MKFTHSLVCINIILIHLTLASELKDSVDEEAQQQDETKLDDGFQEENRQLILEQVKANLLKVLGLKEVPRKPHNKAYVPHAILEEYRKLRDSVRDTIPDDRDFYGKIQIHDLDKSHDDFWAAVYNKYGSYDINVDMEAREQSSQNNRFHIKGEATHITYLAPQHEPENVPPDIEHLLPPFRAGKRKFDSVHLKFNLSQQSLASAAELRGAELHLSRDRVLDCDFFTDHSQVCGKVKPRYQRVYVLRIYDYDKHNEPIASIHESQRIDTQQTTPLVFDIYDIIKYWLLNPKKNFGIIVRVTNDDEEFEKYIQRNQTAPTNASKVVEHVRLKRGFQLYSENDETWIRKRPSLLIYAQNSPAPTRRHSKRDHSSSETESGSVENVDINSSRRKSLDDNHTTSRRDSKYSSGTNQNNQRNIGTTGARLPSSGNGQNQRAKGKARGGSRVVERCNKKSLSINFDDVGWTNWIIAPQSYFANFCSGDCTYPMNDVQNATNHAIIQSIFHSVGRVVPRSCCAPTKLGRMAILYQLDGIVQMKVYEDMIVESCGCL